MLTEILTKKILAEDAVKEEELASDVICEFVSEKGENQATETAKKENKSHKKAKEPEYLFAWKKKETKSS